MEKTRIDVAAEITPRETQENDEVRTLKDLELLLVGGGGDDITTW